MAAESPKLTVQKHIRPVLFRVFIVLYDEP